MIRSLVRMAILSILAAITLLAQETKINGSQNAPSEQKHTEWVQHVLASIATIKPGMTRRELLSVFDADGGLSTRTQGTYIYKHCPYIKVDVAFWPADRGAAEKAGDRIVRISRPYLAHPVYD